MLAPFIFSYTSGTGNNFVQNGTVISGFNTDPAVMAGLSASATYNGSTLFTASQGLGKNTYASGTTTLNANFGADTISGSIDLADSSSDAGYAFAPTTIGIYQANITGNSFTSPLTINPTELGIGSVSNAALNGQFYETNATSVGATFSGSGVATDGTTPVHFQGGLLASQWRPVPHRPHRYIDT